MRYWTGWAVAFCVCAQAAAASATPGATAEVSAQPLQERGGLPPAKGRLKFKSAGPVCMCGDGLSEKDIERAMSQPKLEKPTSPGTDASRSQVGDKEQSLNNGATK